MSNFETTGLRPEILRAIGEMGFAEPTEIQSKVIPALLTGQRDLIALAQTGTGKTAAFGLPLLNQVDPYSPDVQAIILSPTRELAIQILNDLERFGRYLPHVRATAVYGGAAIATQAKALRDKPHIVVGTPGRVLDFINRGQLKLGAVQWLVLDEADEMLTMGFQQELDSILEHTPKEKQTLLFSATMPEAFRRLKDYLNNPEEISVGKRNTGASGVSHEYCMVHAKDRYEALKRIINVNPDIYGIIFCRTKLDTADLARKLMHDGFDTGALNGDMSQSQREDVMEKFRARNIRLLVATDVAARGVDVTDLTHVIHFDLPDDPEVYIHRSGRTGRAGKTGVSIAIVHTRERGRVRNLERMIGRPFVRVAAPTGRDICEKQLFNLIKKVEDVSVDEVQIAQFMPAVVEKLASMDRDELIKRFLSVEFNHYLAQFKDASDINVDPGDDRGRPRDRDDRRDPRGDFRDRDRDPRGSFRDREPRGDFRDRDQDAGDRPPFVSFNLNIGSKHHANPQRLLGMINEQLNGKRMPIGRITILNHESFFEAPVTFTNDLMEAFKYADFDGHPVEIRPDPGKQPAGGAGKPAFKKKKFGDKDKPRKRVRN